MYPDDTQDGAVELCYIRGALDGSQGFPTFIVAFCSSSYGLPVPCLTLLSVDRGLLSNARPDPVLGSAPSASPMFRHRPDLCRDETFFLP